MLDRRMFADMRRAGSKPQIVKAMLEVLAQLPGDCEPRKETVVASLGMLGQMSATRDVNAAWNEAKKTAARQYPDRYVPFWAGQICPLLGLNMNRHIA